MRPTRPRWLFLLCLVCASSAFAAEAIVEPAADPAGQLVVPPGFTVELAAGPPLVQHPTMADFDDQGRLYVCDGPGMNMPAKDLMRELPNLIRRLEDTDGDGRFDRSTMFADKMTFPMGAVWYQGAVYTASPPHIWRLRDTDGDGVADERTILVSEFGFTGNAADIHGCFLGPDGRIYWCDGRHGHNFVDEKGNQISKGLAARLFSCRLDGSDVEAFAGGGMDNPVEVTFTERGEPIGTVAIFDVIEGRHDALVHWVYGGAYPRYEQPCVNEFKRTGDLLPPLSRFNGIAPSGLTRYRGRQFGPEFRDNVFYVGFNTHNVVRAQVEREGASFRSKDEDFLSCSNPDFHPTDVLEDADGSLLVIDTGGWFRIGCPTSQIAKPDVLGGIYRIRRTGEPAVSDPRGLKLAWENAPVNALVGRLNDPRPAVSDRAMAEIPALGDEAVKALDEYIHAAANSLGRGRAVWTLARINTPEARGAIRAALENRDENIRQIATRCVGTLRDPEAMNALVAGLPSERSLAVRREAATALGRIRRPEAVKALLASASSLARDRFADHAVTYALIQLNDRNATLIGLADQDPNVRRVALVALDQMPSGELTREQVAPLLDTSDIALQKAALSVIQRHEGWASATVALLAHWLAAAEVSADRRALVRSVVLAFARDEKIQAVVSETLARPKLPRETSLLLLDIMAAVELAQLPASWQTQLGRLLAGTEPRVVRQAVVTVAARGGELFDQQLVELARDTQRPEELRLAALAILAKHGAPLDDGSFHLLTSRLSPEIAPIDRLAAAEAVGSAKLSPQQLEQAVALIAAAGPLELPALVRAVENAKDVKLGRELVEALTKSPGVENLSADRLQKLLSGYSSEVQTTAAPLLKRLSVDLDQQRARLSELAANLEGGDAVRGKLVFTQQKAACSACHKARNEGAIIGPDLTKIGQIRSRQDLIESVVFPSASFARGYECYSVVSESGQVYAGLLARETADSVYLRTAQREEIRIPRDEIEQIVPSKISIMPQGLDKILTPQELRDLFAFLQSLK